MSMHFAAMKIHENNSIQSKFRSTQEKNSFRKSDFKAGIAEILKKKIKKCNMETVRSGKLSLMNLYNEFTCLHL
jgi:hypothetical protein